MTTKEAAEFMGMTRHNLREHLRNGRVKISLVNGRYDIKKDDLEKWMKERAAKNKSRP